LQSILNNNTMKSSSRCNRTLAEY